MKKILIVTGTRPELIKMSPIIKKLHRKNIVFVHSGQHYDYNLSLQFMKELSLPRPDFQFRLKFSEPALQTSEMIRKLDLVIKNTKPSIVCVQGDTNTVLASALTALKNKIPIAHIESGLRSFDWRMPEEHNRIMVSHISDLLFAPTRITALNLEKENVHGKIFITGNTVIDAIEENIKYVDKKSKITPPDEFVLVTLHRSENVDNPIVLKTFVNALTSVQLPIVFPIHPHTMKNLENFGLLENLKKSNFIKLLKPVGYFDILRLMRDCKFIVTDSGGIQEEATSPSLRKFTLVLRKTTDRPEAVLAGLAKLVGLNYGKIVYEIEQSWQKTKIKKSRQYPYGKGSSANKICSVLQKFVA